MATSRQSNSAETESAPSPGLEVDAAVRAGKPVFAFLVDPSAHGPQSGSRTALLTERDKSAEILKAIRQAPGVQGIPRKRDYATDLHHPGRSRHASDRRSVPTSRRNLAPRRASTTRIWQPLFCHALQPAPALPRPLNQTGRIEGLAASPRYSRPHHLRSGCARHRQDRARQ